MWEVFNYFEGAPLAKYPFKWLAALHVKTSNKSLDYARKGEGWLP